MQHSKNHKGNILVVLISYMAFISLGLPDGLLGVSWPFISERHGIPLDSLGILLVSFVTGYLSTSTSTGKIMSVVSMGLLLAVSCFITGVSLLTYAYAQHWILVIIATFFLGSGGGAIDTSINTFAASQFSPSVVNWLHAFYGIGATAGPFIVTWMLIRGNEWFHGYFLVGSIQIVLALVFVFTLKYWKLSHSKSAEVATGTYREALGMPRFWLTLCIFFIYTGLEAGVGQWAFTILTQSRNIEEESAGLWTSAYWGSLTAGRIIFGFVLIRLRVQIVLLSAFAGIVLGSVLFLTAPLPLIAFVGIVIIGFANAPVFPCLISITPQQVGAQHAGNAIGFQVSAALIGSAVLPGFAGLMTDYFGWEVIPLLFVIESILLLTLYLAVSGRSYARA
jgi:fucose permease